MESSLLIQEMTTNEYGTSSDDELVIYNFQLASPPYADTCCGDLTEYYYTNN